MINCLGVFAKKYTLIWSNRFSLVLWGKKIFDSISGKYLIILFFKMNVNLIKNLNKIDYQ